MRRSERRTRRSELVHREEPQESCEHSCVSRMASLKHSVAVNVRVRPDGSAPIPFDRFQYPSSVIEGSDQTAMSSALTGDLVRKFIRGGTACTLMAYGQTGSGKTCAFLLPAVARISKAAMARVATGREEGEAEAEELCGFDEHAGAAAPQVLVLAPTRELAGQIQREVQRLCFEGPVRSVQVHGGANARPQLQQLARGPLPPWTRPVPRRPVKLALRRMGMGIQRAERAQLLFRRRETECPPQSPAAKA